MTGFEDELDASVVASASFGAPDVGERVARRRRNRRIGVGIGAAVVLVVGAASMAALLGGDDDPDLDVAAPTTTVSTSTPPGDGPVAEDPVGSDGVAGAMSDRHVETVETFGFTECGAAGEPGPPADDRAAALDAVVDALRAEGLHDQPFVVSSGGPQSIWGVVSIGLSSRYEPTLQWIADRADPADVCIEFPEFGLRNLPPALAPVTFEVDAPAGTVTVTAEGCAPKGEWVHPFILNRTGSAEVGIAIGRGGLVFTDDCPAPTPHVFELLNKDPVSIAQAPGTLVFEGPVSPGAAGDFSFDPVNAAKATTGDDLIAQHVDDPTVQFQVSDIFSGTPVGGPVGEVALDQWTVTGSGTIVVPAGVPAGSDHVRLIDAPELNGVLEVAG